MKWMSSAAFLFVVVSAAARAQSGKDTGGPSKMNEMKMMNVAYTGCVESVNHGAAFLLTHVATDAKAMQGAHMMKGDAPAMKAATAPAGAMAMDTGSLKTVALTGVADLQKHAGQTVSVTGAISDAAPIWRDLPTLAVRSLKVVAKSCSESPRR